MVEVQFKSNIRLGLEHLNDENQVVGAHKILNESEQHILVFERYLQMPAEMELQRADLLKKAQADPAFAVKMREECMVNPWLITGIDNYQNIWTSDS